MNKVDYNNLILMSFCVGQMIWFFKSQNLKIFNHESWLFLFCVVIKFMNFQLSKKLPISFDLPPPPVYLLCFKLLLYCVDQDIITYFAGHRFQGSHFVCKRKCPERQVCIHYRRIWHVWSLLWSKGNGRWVCVNELVISLLGIW